MGRRLPIPKSSIALAAVVATGLLASTALIGFEFRQDAPVSAGISGPPRTAGGHMTVNVTLASHRPWPLPVRAALLPVQYEEPSQRVYVLLDAARSAMFGNSPEVSALVDQLRQEIQNLGSTTSVGTLNASQLSSFLTGNHSAMLVVANYGALPSSVLNSRVNLLTPWLEAGGSLVWAGGPLGYYEWGSPPVNGSSTPGGLGWQGQQDLLGYPLVDPPANSSMRIPLASASPLTGTNQSALGSGLGLEYNGTGFGANLTELELHGGIDLGVDTSVNSTAGPSARTSLAYVPVGNGSVFYFGGAVSDPSGAYVPEGGVRLSLDIGQLVAHPFVPVSGAVIIEEVNLSAYQQTSIVLTGNETSSVVGLLVECQLAGSVVFELAQQLVPAPPTNGTGLAAAGGLLSATVHPGPTASSVATHWGASAGCAAATRSTPAGSSGCVSPVPGVARLPPLSRSTSTY